MAVPVSRLALLLALAPALAGAQDLADPTRPPEALRGGVAGAASAGGGGPVLQSVIISERLTGVLVDGRLVKVGERLGDAELVKVSQTGAVFRTGHELNTVKLFPAVEKKAAKAAGKPETRR